VNISDSAMVLDGDSIQQSLAAIFDQTQLTTTNHRKNCVSLYKIHVRVSHTAINSKSGTSADLKFVGEQYFGDAFIDMINRILVVKKGTSTADRTVKFVGEYVKYVNEKGMLFSIYSLQLGSPCIPPSVRRKDQEFTQPVTYRYHRRG
jgi:condensin complex subunit 3